MPRYPVEKSLLREPNLWVPGKQPVGPVKIDASHNLSAGLTCAAIVTERGAEDLVNRSVATNSSSNITKQVGVDGRVINSAASTTSYASFIGSKNGLSGTGAYSIVGSFKQNTITVNNYILSQRGPDYSGIWRVYSSGASGIYVSAYTSSYNYNVIPKGKYGATSDLSNLLWNTIGISHDGTDGTNVNFYHDGIHSDTLVCTGATNFNNVANDVVFLGSSRTGAPCAICDVSFLYLWQGRELTDVEHASIVADPYQFLIPA